MLVIPAQVATQIRAKLKKGPRFLHNNVIIQIHFWQRGSLPRNGEAPSVKRIEDLTPPIASLDYVTECFGVDLVRISVHNSH
jgi:hypothetical protein